MFHEPSAVELVAWPGFESREELLDFTTVWLSEKQMRLCR